MAEKSSKSGQSGKSKGGQHSGGNFKNDPKRASEAGKKGGEHSPGGTHEQHVKAGQQSHKNK
jgi:general stress protein YciG